MKLFVNLYLALFLVFTNANVITIQLKREINNDIEDNKIFLSQESNTNQIYELINVQNYKKQWYTGTISLGKGKKNLKVILSTGSNQLMIPSKSCVDQKNCNVNQNETFKYLNNLFFLLKGFEKYYECQSQDGCTPTNSQGTYNYLDSTLTGNYVNTLVSIGDLESIQQSVLLFDQSNNFTAYNQKVNGILGLGGYNFNNDGNSSFVTSLYKQGLIKENMFSLYLGFKNDDSQLTLGGINPQNLADKAKVFTHQLIQNDQSDLQRWVLQITQFDMGVFSYKFNTTYNKALVDSSYPYIGLEQSLYEKVAQYFIKRHANVTKNGLKVDCKDPNLSNMYFYLIQERTLSQCLYLPIDFYLSNTTYDCQILISPINSNQNYGVILGSPFLRRYVSSYSYQNKQITFTQSIADPKDDTSNDFSITDLPTWAIIVIVIAAVIVLCIGGGIFAYKKYKNKQMGNSLQISFSSNTSSH